MACDYSYSMDHVIHSKKLQTIADRLLRYHKRHYERFFILCVDVKVNGKPANLSGVDSRSLILSAPGRKYGIAHVARLRCGHSSVMEVDFAGVEDITKFLKSLSENHFQKTLETQLLEQMMAESSTVSLDVSLHLVAPLPDCDASITKVTLDNLKSCLQTLEDGNKFSYTDVVTKDRVGSRRKSITFERGLLLLTLVCAVYLGEACEIHDTPLSIAESPSSASVVQGNSHTFFCKGNGSILYWEVNNTLVANIPDDWKLKLIDVDIDFQEGCVVESWMTLLAENSSMSKITTTFTVDCIMTNDFVENTISQPAYLDVYVIGEARDVKFALPITANKPTMMQWKPPYTCLSPSLFHYDVSVRLPSSMGIISRNTTTDTSFAISSDLVPCESYLLTVVPFQQLSTHVEVGMETRMTRNYTGAIVPATDIMSSVSMDLATASAQVTIYFQAIFTNCYLQWPDKFAVELMKDGLNENSIFQSTERIVNQGMNTYLLEKKLALRQGYWISVKLTNEFSNSISESLVISTFQVQNVSLETIQDRNQLNVRCMMAEGAEGKQCTVEMRNGAGDVQRNCIEISDGAGAACNLVGLTPGEYVVWAYDAGYNEEPAVRVVFIVTEELTQVSTNTPTSEVDDDITLATSASIVQGQQAWIIGTIIGVVITIASIITLMLLVIAGYKLVHFRKQKSDRLESGAPDEVHNYLETIGNDYHKGPLPLAQPSSIAQEPEYAQPQVRTVSTMATANESSNGYKQHLSEWFSQRPSENPSLPHTPDLLSTAEHTHL